MLENFDLTTGERGIAADWLEDRIGDGYENVSRLDEVALLRGTAPVKLTDGVVKLNWTKEDILPMLENNNKAVWRALEVLLERQTADERQSENTVHSNKRGFNARDAKFGTDLANRVIDWRAGKSTYRYPLSMNQLTAARRMLRKYAGQLARVANGEETPVAV